MSLVGAIEKARAEAEKLKAKKQGNEANTKALVIEPMLAALGWDPTDLDQVVREHKVFDGTSLDYAILLNDKPGLYVEAKSVTSKLSDKGFIAQTINYANNDGVVWCVLSNGLSWRVYKTNEPVAMDQKLLFEVDLADVDTPANEAAQQLRLISRQAVEGGELDLWGQRVFTDTRVRKALSELAKDGPRRFLNVIKDAIGEPQVADPDLRSSLARVLDASQAAVAVPKTKPKPNGNVEYPVERHTDGKPTAIVDLFEQVDEYGRSLGADVTRRPKKWYIGYFRGKAAFFTVEIQKQRVLVYLKLDPDQTDTSGPALRDVRGIGHYGMGDVEFSLRKADDLDAVRALIEAAYKAGS